MTDETTLVHQLQNPKFKEQAFRVLVHQYKERLYWHIRKIVISHDDTDDVLQNTFIKVFRGINQFKGDSKLYSWMYRIATNESITFINKKAMRLQLSSQEMQDYLVNNLESDVYFEGDKIQLALHKALAKLPEKQRQVFNMKYFQDLKYKEIAEILEVSEGACKSNYHHATKKIEEYLKEA